MEVFSAIITLSLIISCVVILIARLFTERIDFLFVFSWTVAVVISLLWVIGDGGTFGIIAKYDVYALSIIVFLSVLCYALYSSIVQFSSFHIEDSCLERGCIVFVLPFLIGTLFGGLDNENGGYKRNLYDYETYEERYCVVYHLCYEKPANRISEIVEFAKKLRNEDYRLKAYYRCMFLIDRNSTEDGYKKFSNALGLNNSGIIVLYENRVWQVVFYFVILISLIIIIFMLLLTKLKDKNSNLLRERNLLQCRLDVIERRNNQDTKTNVTSLYSKKIE